MGIFGFGSSNKPTEDTSSTTMGAAEFTSSEASDDMYSPTGQSTFDDFASSSASSENSYDKMPDFMQQLSFDAAKLQPMTVQGGIDFLQVEDQYGGGSSSGGAVIGGSASLAPSRGWTDDLCYGTGTTYLLGLTLGGAYGMVEGLRKSAQGPQNMKVRLNTTLNSITRRGPGLGNAVGVVAMMYNGTTALIDYSRGQHDIFNSVGGGAIAGAIFKSTAGPRAMAVSSGICAAAAGLWSLGVSAFAEN